MAGKQKTADVLRRQALFQMLREADNPPTIAQLAERLEVDGDTVCADLMRLQQSPYSDPRTLQRVRIMQGDYARISAVMVEAPMD